MDEIFTIFYFLLKSKMAAKISFSTPWVKNSIEIALSLTVSEIFTIFYFSLKFKMAAINGKNLYFPFCSEYYCAAIQLKICSKSLYL